MKNIYIDSQKTMITEKRNLKLKKITKINKHNI